MYEYYRSEKSKHVIDEINSLKQLLANSDYKALKYAEGEISYTDYEPVRQYRQGLRDKINLLEMEERELGMEEI